MFNNWLRHFWLRWLLILASLFCLLFIFRYPILDSVASYLIVSAPLAKADAIVVLGGDFGTRVYFACQLFKQGYAPKMVVCGGALGWRLNFAQNMRDEARFLGVPEKGIILENRSMSTWENAQLVLPIIEKNKWKKIILVSSPYHMRRAILVFEKVFRGHEIVIVPAPAWTNKYSNYNPYRWWTRQEDTAFVVLEYIKLTEYLWKRYI